MTIPFNNFQREYTRLETEINTAVKRVLQRGNFILGPEDTAFEEHMSDYLGVKHTVGVGNGTDAITLALMALNVGKGDEVITTNMTAYPTIVGIMQSGAKPIVVDIDIDTGMISPQEIEKHITKKTKAIIPVHLYGAACEMDEIMHIAEKKNITVVEDCAQSFGSKYKNQMTGTFGKISTFSFYPTKNLGAYGDGGAIATNDASIYEQLIKLHNYGQSKRYYHDVAGINSRLDEVQAAILQVKLAHLNQHVKKRRSIAARYDKELKTVTPLFTSNNVFHTYHLYVIRSKNRDGLQHYLAEKGITTLIHYPVPVNEQKGFHGQKNESFPATRQFVNEILSIPLHPDLTNTEVSYIIDVINSYEKN